MTIEYNVAEMGLERVKEFLRLQDAHIIEGGPSINDPCGLVDRYVSFRGQNNTGFWFGVDVDGNIVVAGANINDQSVKFPQIIQL